MKVILFSNTDNNINRKLVKILEAVSPRNDIETFATVQSLSNRLKIDTSDISIILLSITRHDTLNELLMIRNKLMGHRIILILPDQRNETLSKAHLLYPRFISYKDADFEDLKAVIDKMLSYLIIHSKIKSIKETDYPWTMLQHETQIN